MSVSDGDKEHDYRKWVQKAKLISLVESRPVLWDKTLEIYKDKDEKAAAWNEVCAILMDKYLELPAIEKNDFKKFVARIWGQTRDSWIRSLKLSSKKPDLHTKYKYHNQMLFLLEVVLQGDNNYLSVILSPESKQALLDESQGNKRETAYNLRSEDKADKKYQEQDTHIIKRVIKNRKTKNVENNRRSGTLFPESKRALLYESQENNRETVYNSRSKDKADKKYQEQATNVINKDVTNRKRKKEENDGMKSYLAYQNSLTEDRNLTFFKSLLPSLVSLDDDQTLEFHAGVLSLLQNVKRRPANQEWNVESQAAASITFRDSQSPSPSSMSELSQESGDPLHLIKKESL